jgi:hypothetical protein
MEMAPISSKHIAAAFGEQSAGEFSANDRRPQDNGRRAGRDGRVAQG